MSALLMRTRYHGHDEVREWVEEMKRDWATFEVRPERYVDVGGDRVLTIGAWHAQGGRLRGGDGRPHRAGRGGGVPLDFPQASWLTQYRNGKVVLLQTFTDRKKALEAAGLSE
jgi:hypothetical protein